MTFDQSVAYSGGNHSVVKIKDKKKDFFKNLSREITGCTLQEK